MLPYWRGNSTLGTSRGKPPALCRDQNPLDNGPTLGVHSNSRSARTLGLALHRNSLPASPRSVRTPTLPVQDEDWFRSRDSRRGRNRGLPRWPRRAIIGAMVRLRRSKVADPRGLGLLEIRPGRRRDPLSDTV